MANAMSEQVKWTTKIGVNDAISRSVRFALSRTDLLGGTASDTKTVQKKKKKGGGLLGSKKYDTVQSFTASYNTNDSMFGGRVFDDRTDLDFAYGILAKRILGNQLMNKVITTNGTNDINLDIVKGTNSRGFLSASYSSDGISSKIYTDLSAIRDNGGGFIKGGRPVRGSYSSAQTSTQYIYEGSLAEYLDRKIASSNIELNADQFIKAFNGQSTLGSMGMLIDTSRDNEIKSLINNMKEQYSRMGASQEKVDMLALINFYENIQALLDKEGKAHQYRVGFLGNIGRYGCFPSLRNHFHYYRSRQHNGLHEQSGHIGFYKDRRSSQQHIISEQGELHRERELLSFHEVRDFMGCAVHRLRLAHDRQVRLHLSESLSVLC